MDCETGTIGTSAYGVPLRNHGSVRNFFEQLASSTMSILSDDDDVFDVTHFKSCKMFFCLWLRACLVCWDEQQCAVHNHWTCKHCRHQWFVAWCVDDETLRTGASDLSTGCFFLPSLLLAVVANFLSADSYRILRRHITIGLWCRVWFLQSECQSIFRTMPVSMLFFLVDVRRRVRYLRLAVIDNIFSPFQKVCEREMKLRDEFSVRMWFRCSIDSECSVVFFEVFFVAFGSFVFFASA